MLRLPPRLLRAIKLRVELVKRLVIVEQHTGLIDVRRETRACDRYPRRV